MRFDDTLETVLAGDLGSPQAAQSAWRQVVDLIGRRRAPADARAMSTLRAIRANVPVAVRAASARALEFADPPAPLVRLFAMDDLSVALPVLRNARMTSAEWIQLLPELAPGGRAVLRNRRDLGPIVKRALEAFGPIDFVLPDESVQPVAEVQPEPGPVPEPELAPEIQPEPVMTAPAPVSEPVAEVFETEVPNAQREPVAEVEEPIALPEPTPIVEPEPVEPDALETLSEPDVPAGETEDKPVPDVEAELEPVTYWTGSSAVTRPAPPFEIEMAAEAVTPAPEPVGTIENIGLAPHESEDLSFVSLIGSVAALSLSPPPQLGESEVAPPQVQSGTVEPAEPIEAIAPAADEPQGPAMDQGNLSVAGSSGDALDLLSEEGVQAPAGDAGTFEIAEVVARIDAFWRDRERTEPAPVPPADHFRFETDAAGVLRWVEGVSRSALVGLSLDTQAPAVTAEGSRIDGVAAGAFRRRAGFSNARLAVDGESDAAGDWLISAIPVFDPANGRFTGYRGTGRRPRADERAEPVRQPSAIPPDSLRQLVHELRTPTNAIAGFAEMIESQILGPVSDPYRDRAGTIRTQARELLGAIDDLDLAARIDSAALTLSPGRVALRPLLSGIADDLAPLAELRGAALALPIDDLAVSGDRRAVERLLARLLATLVSASGPGERIGVNLAQAGDGLIAITIDRPRALADYPGDSVLGIDDEQEDATLLGTGFALRLARNLARELGGALIIEPESLTLRLPASDNAHVGQAHLN